jgi:hypothetical protein
VTARFVGEVDVTGRVDLVELVALHSQDTAAAKIVIPRSRSCGWKSVTVVPSCTSPVL